MTEQGVQLAERLNKCLPGEIFPKTDLKHHMEAAWHEKDALVCIMARGLLSVMQRRCSRERIKIRR